MTKLKTTHHLTEEQVRFVSMMGGQSWLQCYWNFSARECDLTKLQMDLIGMSHGKKIMAQFFVAIWLGDNVLKFDVLEAVSVLDSKELNIIRGWLCHPFWP